MKYAIRYNTRSESGGILRNTVYETFEGALEGLRDYLFKGMSEDKINQAIEKSEDFGYSLKRGEWGDEEQICEIIKLTMSDK